MIFPHTSSAVRAVIAGSALTILMVYLQRYAPLAALLVPLPCISASLFAGRKAGYLIALTSVAALSLLGPHEVMLYLLQAASISLLVPELISRGKRWSNAILSAVAVNTVLLSLFFLSFAVTVNGNVDARMRDAIHEATGRIEEVYKTAGISGTDLRELVTSLRQAENIISRVYPSLIVIFLWIGAACNLFLARRLLRRFGKEIPCEPFSLFRNPDHLVWLLIASGFALLADHPHVSQTALNLLIAIMFLYFIQGMAVLSYFYRKYSLSFLILLVSVVLILAQPLMVAPISAIGLIDLWVDFRTPKKQKTCE